MKQKAFGAALSGRFDSAAALICFLFFVFGSAVGTFSGSSLSSSAMVVVNSVQRGLFGYINGFSFLFRFVGFSIFCFIVLYISSLCVVSDSFLPTHLEDSTILGNCSMIAFLGQNSFWSPNKEST